MSKNLWQPTFSILQKTYHMCPYIRIQFVEGKIFFKILFYQKFSHVEVTDSISRPTSSCEILGLTIRMYITGNIEKKTKYILIWCRKNIATLKMGFMYHLWMKCMSNFVTNYMIWTNKILWGKVFLWKP